MNKQRTNFNSPPAAVVAMIEARRPNEIGVAVSGF
jgi:hypothetical protein